MINILGVEASTTKIVDVLSDDEDEDADIDDINDAVTETLYIDTKTKANIPTSRSGHKSCRKQNEGK